MNKLCLSTYLSVLVLHNSSKKASQTKILNGLIKSICTKPETIDKYLTSHIKCGRRNLPLPIKDNLEEINYQNPHFLENFKSNVEIFLHPGKHVDICKILRIIALNDNVIAKGSTIDFILQTKKGDLSPIESPLDFIAGVFLYVLRTNNDDTTEYAKMTTAEYCKNAIQEFNALTNMRSSYTNSGTIGNTIDSDIPSQAKSFCRKYEDSIELLPLCQIANIINPIHNHINKMYSDYCDCSNELKKQIMKEIECPMIQVDDEYTLYRLLRNFSDDIEKLGLASTNKTYMFPQYVIKSLEYEKLDPIDINPNLFPLRPSKLISGQKASTLSRFISDYLYYKDKDTFKALPIPFDWMWDNFSFGSCPESDLITWLNLFIISSCPYIQKPPKDKKRKHKSPKIPNIYNAKTIEDLHFLALLWLYDTYLCK